MKRILAQIYMLILRGIAAIFRPFKLQTKVVMLVTFQDNPEQILKKMTELRVSPETIVFYDPRVDESKLSYNFVRTIPLTFASVFKRLYHMSRAKVVIVDNYFPELAAINFKKDACCIQIWHANGALKKFAWEDKATALRTKSEQNRFKAVYARFHKVVVGSDAMGEIFKRSFLLESEDRLLKTGVPSTDYFFDQEEINRIRASYQEKYQKKTILYAPTFRDKELNQAQLLLDLEKMRALLADKFVLLLKLHPSIQADADIPEDEFVKLFHKNESMREALAGSDVLVTDYSSSPFEFALLGRPIYFFAPDIEQYDRERGLVTGFSELIPGKPYLTTESLAHGILNDEADLEEIARFSATWNQYSKGHSAANLVDFIQKKL
ncbi:CDP-glycerol glycerophosphotransferase family protein [Listeria kieliensis]